MHADTQIIALIDELDDLRKSRDDHWQIPHAEGEVLYQIALASRAKTIVELGTSYGFSGLFWAAALRHFAGVLHTIDIDPKKVESAKETFRRAGLSETVVNHLGDAMQVIPTLRGPFDIAFLDVTDKKAARRYFDLLWPSIRPGGSIITDNVMTHREEMADYVSYVRGRPGATSTEISVGNGVEWTLKLS